MRFIHLQFIALVSLGVATATTPERAGAQESLSGTHQSVGGAPVMHQDPEVKQAGWPSLPLPKITMPKLTMPKVTMPDMSTVTKPVKASFSKISSGTKKAWEGTKELFTFGGDKEPQPAETNQGFWKRIFPSEPEQPSGPQTVGEWMAQPRLDP